MTRGRWTFRGPFANIVLQLDVGAADERARSESLRHVDALAFALRNRDPAARRVVHEMCAELLPWACDALRRGPHADLGSRTDEIVARFRSAARSGRLVATERAIRRIAPALEADAEEEFLGPEVGPSRPPELLFDPRWSLPRVEVGTEVMAIVSYADIRSPVDAVVVVSEVDGPAGRQEVARIPTRVPAGTGVHEVRWKRSPDEAQADLRNDAASGDEGPLEYRFHVESRSPSCAGESGPLWLTNTVTVNLVKTRDRRKHEPERTVVLRDALGDEVRARSKDGSARFEKVLVGPVRLRMATPRFTELSWSEAEVPVGEPVEAVFRYEDATAGAKARVVVYEIDHDGSRSEIDSLEVKLGGAAGEARVSFTRTEDQAQQDIAADELEGDTGPLEYRFRVVADGEWSDLSGPLWLTHTVSVTIDATGGGSADGRHLVLFAADGAEHRAVVAGGSARFEGVVCGPMTVKLEPRAKEAA